MRLDNRLAGFLFAGPLRPRRSSRQAMFQVRLLMSPHLPCAAELDACGIPRFFRRGGSPMHGVSSVTPGGASRLVSRSTRACAVACYRSLGEMRFTGAASLRGAGRPFRA